MRLLELGFASIETRGVAPDDSETGCKVLDTGAIKTGGYRKSGTQPNDEQT